MDEYFIPENRVALKGTLPNPNVREGTSLLEGGAHLGEKLGRNDRGGRVNMMQGGGSIHHHTHQVRGNKSQECVLFVFYLCTKVRSGELPSTVVP